MEKKLWSNAEVVELGVESTKCENGLVEDTVVLDGGRIIYCCSYCKIDIGHNTIERNIQKDVI